MALINLNFYSEALGTQAEMTVIVPQRGNYGQIGLENNTKPGPYKTLYLLHGLSDDHTTWLRRSSIERYASNWGICVVMPGADKSFYTDMKYGDAYYQHIAREVPAVAREFFNVSDKREDNFIAGLSMGGYGALKIALRECGTFAAAAGLSPVGDIKNLEGFDGILAPVFGEGRDVSDEDDIMYLAEKHKDDPLRPRLFMGIGLEDFLYNNANNLRRKLEECGYDLTYKESHGVHNWDFWDEYIQHVLKWMNFWA